MEGEVVRIVHAVGIAPGRAARGQDVVTVEDPVHVLEGVIAGVGVHEQDALRAPLQQIGGGYESEHIADGDGVAFLVVQAPVALALRVVADREFRARKAL